MKLITLNAWGGKIYEPLISFLKEHSKDVDIFCFQDVLFGSKPEFTPIQKGRVNLFSEIENILSDFNSFIFRDKNESFIHGEMLPLEVGCGQAIFVRKNLKVLDNGAFRALDRETDDDIAPGRCQWIKIKLHNEENLVVMNLHGMWQKGSQKKDTPERIVQSQKVKEFFSQHNSKQIICGDFNMVKDGNAMSMLEEGMVNLVKEYGIQSTRSSHYPKEEKFADYILVSKDIKVNDFKVLQNEVSDHLPLFVDFE